MRSASTAWERRCWPYVTWKLSVSWESWPYITVRRTNCATSVLGFVMEHNATDCAPRNAARALHERSGWWAECWEVHPPHHRGQSGQVIAHPMIRLIREGNSFLGKICLFACRPVTCGAIAKDLRVMLDAQKIAYGAKLLTRNVMRLYSAHRWLPGRRANERKL